MEFSYSETKSTTVIPVLARDIALSFRDSWLLKTLDERLIEDIFAPQINTWYEEITFWIQLWAFELLRYANAKREFKKVSDKVLKVNNKTDASWNKLLTKYNKLYTYFNWNDIKKIPSVNYDIFKLPWAYQYSSTYNVLVDGIMKHRTIDTSITENYIKVFQERIMKNFYNQLKKDMNTLPTPSELNTTYAKNQKISVDSSRFRHTLIKCKSFPKRKFKQTELISTIDEVCKLQSEEYDDDLFG